MMKRLILGLGILGACWLPNAMAEETFPGTWGSNGSSGIVLASDATQPLTAAPQPNIAPAQTNSLTDRDYLLSLINERDRLYSQRFDAQERATAAALQAAKEATQKAEMSADKRFESVNEFRSTLKDQQSNLMLKSEADVRFKALDERIMANSTVLSQTKGQTEGRDWLWGLMVGGAGLLVGIAMLVINLIRSHRPT